MTAALRKNVLKDISKTKARFISIMLIVALGVGFFTGVKATAPSMNASAEKYYKDNCLMDISLLSTVGFSDKDVSEVQKLAHVKKVSPSYFKDAIINRSGSGSVIRLYSDIKEDENGIALNKPIVHEGRLPESFGEIALEINTLGTGGYSIGDVISLEENIGGEYLSDTLESVEYTVVGFVQSPLYVSFERGTTSIGSGKINMYGIICAEEFKSDRYSRLYVLTDYTDTHSRTLDDEYDNFIDSLESQFKDLGEERAGLFDVEYLNDAKQKLADAEETLDSERDKAEKQIADGKESLDNAEREYNEKIEDAEQKLDNAKSQIDSGKKQIEQGYIDLDNGIEQGKAQLDSAQAQLDNAKEELKNGKAEFNARINEAQSQLSKAEREYNKGLEEYNNGLTQFNLETAPAKAALALLKSRYDGTLNVFENITKPSCEKNIEEAQSNIDSDNKEIEQLELKIEQAQTEAEKTVYRIQIAAYQSDIERSRRTIESENERLDTAEKNVNDIKQEYDNALSEYEEQTAEPLRQLEEAKAQLDSAKEQIDSGKAELAEQKAEGEAKLAQAQEDINTGSTAISEGRQALIQKKNEGKQKLKESEQKLKDAEEEYNKGKEELEKQKSEGREKLDEALSTYEEKKAEALLKLSDAQADLDRAKERLEDLSEPEWYFFTRRDNPGYLSLIDDTTRVDAVGIVFPFFFLLVVALVCVTTLTRHVDEKRTEIGTLKALGYSNTSIKAQFIFYSAAACFVGCAIGVVLGMFTLPQVIYNAYSIMYMLIDLNLVVPVANVAAAVIVAFACTTFVALITCSKTLREKPSELMRPKAPKKAKRILLEKLPFIWNRMNFTSKVTARNIARYKARFFMTVIGVAGCTALILTGFGLKNSIGAIADKQFNEIFTYDLVAVLENEDTAHRHKDIIDSIKESEYVDSAMLERQTAIEVKAGNGEALTDDVYLIVPEDLNAMQSLIHIRQPKTGTPLTLQSDGAVITQKMSDVLNLSVGDTLTLTDNNKQYSVRVSGIAENYIYSYVVMNSEYYHTVYGKAPLYNMILGSMTEQSEEAEHKLGAYCLDKDGIVAVSFISGSIKSFNDTVKSLDMVTLVLLVCAALLAVVVLYNLTNINIAERVREIATIKVLGFYNGETCAFVYRENIILTICGIIAGLFVGIVLHRFVILTIEINKTMFTRDIAPLSFLLAAAITAFFAAAVNFVMYFKIKKIDMVLSLKSIE